MEDKNIVYAMNEYTYNKFEESAHETAFKQEDPIEYLLMFASLNIVIDDLIADNLVEVYDEDVYRKMLDEWEEEDYE